MSQFIEMFKNAPRYELCEMANIVMGQSPESKYYNDSGDGMPFYQGKTEFSEKYIGEPTTWCTCPTRVAQNLDLLMSVRAPVGTVNITNGRCCIGRGLAAISPKEGLTDREYLFYALHINEAEIARLGTGSTFQAINKDSLYSISLPLPNIDEQMTFASIAEQADKSKYLS